MELEIAFEHLFVIAKRSMPIHPGEGFMIGLAGYTDGRPTFMFLTRAFNDDIGYITDYPYSYYVSGRKEATELAEARLKASHFSGQTPPDSMQGLLSDIIMECIEKNYSDIGPPLRKLTLDPPQD